MKKLIALTALIATTAAASLQVTLKPGYLFCVSESALDQAMESERMLQYKLDTNECAPTTLLVGMPAETQKIGWLGGASVTVWAYDGKPYTVYTVIEALDRGY